MMNIKTPMGGMTDGGLYFEQAVEIHRLLHEDCLTPTQIARKTGLGLQMVAGVLSGRYFPGALKQWEAKNG